WHRRAGEPHAEALALAAAGEAARGATLYVTLEPCAHHGRTPPCADAVVAAGVARVVVCHRDPDPRVAGRGLERLRAAGIEVELGDRIEPAIRLNLPYLVPRLLGRPTVTLKWAASLDGRIATASGASQWITGPAARRRALELREEHDAVLVGSGTLLADDPRLDRRLGRAPGAILRAVADRRLRAPEDGRWLSVGGPAVVYTESDDGARRARLEARGAEVVRLPAVTPATMLEDLSRRGVRSLLVEGGGRIAGAFRDAGSWDRVVALVAPILIGGAAAPAPIAGDGVAELAAADRLAQVGTRRRGRDLEVEGVNAECSRVLSSRLGG
ncbi:MAG TPA: bifunctional diaminohydroxyphosphoribosylaminopyrimidine deaminase/5-amino-6-(5-phosphoribosylamino)uracil reductase RibD, partial [Thermoanaerobaculia bacterium]|nr:bifunctional diaminohydroxyphosphoribosylaminopyrimidine deaminase/5-amino-6-(5-phosphoribosylamino)uracil reductase RibD [Thermoanaerobaculia bacterium]